MPKLILIRHSLPDIVPAIPANRWSLSKAGRQRCKTLAEKLAVYRPDVFVTSTEPKAIETGRIVAELLDKPCETGNGLHEHERRDVVFGSKERFEGLVASFFAEPQSLVFGSETADQAHQRFSQAIASAVQAHRDQNVAVVAHGTVMTLFVARTAGVEPFPFWKRLGMPAFTVLSMPGFGLLTVVENVESAQSETLE
jgi:broad specificity phosphatase PhoE